MDQLFRYHLVGLGGGVTLALPAQGEAEEDEWIGYPKLRSRLKARCLRVRRRGLNRRHLCEAIFQHGEQVEGHTLV